MPPKHFSGTSMLEHRFKADLGGGDFVWLKARHHFKVTANGEGNPAGARVLFQRLIGRANGLCWPTVCIRFDQHMP
jgi:hypothetical protein